MGSWIWEKEAILKVTNFWMIILYYILMRGKIGVQMTFVSVLMYKGVVEGEGSV